MGKYVNEYKQFAEFSKACDRDKYIGLCYRPGGAGKTEAAKYYTKFGKTKKYVDQMYYKADLMVAKISFAKLNSVLYTASSLNWGRNVIRDIEELQRKFHWAKSLY